MLSKLKGFLNQQQKQKAAARTGKPKAKAQPADNKLNVPKRHPQYNQQWDNFIALYRLIRINPWNESVEKSLHQILDSLQNTSICDHLTETYPKDQIASFKEYALKEYEAMGTANRERVESLVGLADDDMHKTIYECLFLCDINPTETAPFELSDTQGFDAKGNPIMQKNVYQVFNEKALCGVAGLERFLPEYMIEGDSGKNIQGMTGFLNGEYSDLASQLGNNSEPIIKAMTTIGSLGGIGHKPDSDMDLQVIFNTNPEYDYRWNDGDFFIALFAYVLDHLWEDFLERVLPDAQQNAITERAKEQVVTRCQEGLSAEELQIVTSIFPSTYRKALEKEAWKAFNQLKPQQQCTLLWKQISQILPNFPFMEKYLPQFMKCFPLLKSINREKIRPSCFPHSASTLTRDKLAGWLAGFYQDQFLGKANAQQVLRQRAAKKGIPLDQVKGNTRIMLLLEHLSQVKQRAPILKAFLVYIAEHISIEAQDLLAELMQLVKKEFDPQGHFLKEEFLEELLYALQKSFRNQKVSLIDFYSDREAVKVEAKSEYALHKKIQQTEAYLTQKYPSTEVHLFTNILRNQRAGQHTPFLVSPEGSMAYSLMLNDFLLNPAILLCGISPMPFDLPHDFKVMLSVGALPAQEWMVSQTKEGGSDTFSLQSLPDWGEIQIPREKIWQHSIPIYLRESEKVSHRNLPKALLNCWWLEMIVCLEEDQDLPTSLTRLLWHPEDRYYIKNEIEHPYVDAIQAMEKEFPPLIRDPWWLKFTEMLMRFEDTKIQKQIIFCFTQHIRLSDIIDFNNDAKPIWLDKTGVNWRKRSLVKFYELFVPQQQERFELMKFAQGRDDIGNRMEEELKESFLQSMTKVEQKLLSVGTERAMKQIMRYLSKIGGPTFMPRSVEGETRKHLEEINRQMVIADETILQKANTEATLNSMEQIQLAELKKDRDQMHQYVEGLVEHYQKFQIKASSQTMEKYILDARVKLAGDPLENVIFKYHFERNFKRKPFQVPLPISKSLSIPRKKIMLGFSPGTQNWMFKSVLSKSDSRGKKEESEMEMFEDQMVEGLARCVFSGYVGFSSKNLTSFEKPAVRHSSPVATNPLTHQDLQDLAFIIHDFFKPKKVNPQELLENIHYISEILMLCNVNRFGTISLVVRDNFGDHFVVNFSIAKIKVKVPSNQLVTQDENFPRFFLQLHSKDCRQMFVDALDQLKIKLDPERQPQFKTWVNHGDFELTVSPKFYRIYANGVANEIWSAASIGTPAMLAPAKLSKTLDSLGKQAIQDYQRIEAEKKKLFEKARQKNAIRARSYMDKKRNELGL